MEYKTILYIMLAIVSFDFVLENLLGYLNHRHAKLPVPSELSDVYDHHQYLRSQSYENTRYKFGLWTDAISFIATFLILYFGYFGVLDKWLRAFAPNELLLSLYFFGVLYLITDILSTPFQLYNTFVIEEKFGFNKSTIRTFLFDKLKGYLLAIIIGGILLAVLIFMVFALGSSFWWWFLGVITIFMVVMNMFYTSWIVPLFNKLTPLVDGDLRSAIEKYAQQVNFPLKNIFVIDGSKRSSKANAFFSGFGKNKKIVLYDTLIEKHTTEELVAVLAHEAGHFKKRHILLGMFLSIGQAALMLYLLSIMVYNAQISFAMGGMVSAMHLNLLAFGILFSPLSNLLGLIMNAISRKHEYEADAYAVQTYHKEPLKSALKKLSSDNLSNLTPHPAYVFMHYSHPPLLHRLRAIDSLN